MHAGKVWAKCGCASVCSYHSQDLGVVLGPYDTMADTKSVLVVCSIFCSASCSSARNQDMRHPPTIRTNHGSARVRNWSCLDQKRCKRSLIGTCMIWAYHMNVLDHQMLVRNFAILVQYRSFLGAFHMGA